MAFTVTLCYVYIYHHVMYFIDFRRLNNRWHISEWGQETNVKEWIITLVARAHLASCISPPNLNWGASKLTLRCLSSYTGAPLKIHWSASQVTLGCLQTYTGVPLKLHWCASQLTLGCLLFYIDVPPNLHWSTSQLTLICFPLHWFASQLTVGLKNGIDLLQLTPLFQNYHLYMTFTFIEPYLFIRSL